MGDNVLVQWMEAMKLDAQAVPQFLSQDRPSDFVDKNKSAIEQDVNRTRSNEKYFSSKTTRLVMRKVLSMYCSFNNITYVQGLNEILAPILSLHSNNYHQPNSDDVIEEEVFYFDDTFDESEDTALLTDYFPVLLVFEALIERVSPIIFKKCGDKSLQAQLAGVHVLLYYYDAELVKYLMGESMSTDIYAQSWLITFFSRRLPVPLVLHLWNILIQKDSPSFLLFVVVSFMESRRYVSICCVCLCLIYSKSDRTCSQLLQNYYHKVLLV